MISAMNACHKPYAIYKSSNIRWHGNVPAHWEIKPLIHWIGINEEVLPETTNPDFEFLYLEIGSVGTGVLTDEPNRIRFATAPSRARRIVKNNDTVISTVRTYLKAVWFASETNVNLICSTGFTVLSPRLGTVPKFVNYLVQSNSFSDQITAESVGIAYPAIAEGRLKSLYVTIPPFLEQAAIVRYLDYVDGRIRRYISARKKLVKLLEEQKRALIHRAVTRGLDPNVRLKPSGIEWLGDMPAHWEIKPLKHWIGVNEAVLTENTDPYYEFQYLEISSVGTNILIEEPKKFRFAAAPSRARRIVRNSDTIISTVRTYLKAVWFASETNGDLICSTGFTVLTPRLGIVPKFVSYLVQSNSFTDQITAESVGIAYPAISEGRLGALRVPIPSFPEQKAIAEYLDKATANIDSAISRTRRQIELLSEYRTRLIADVVTGKLDVRETAANLLDE